MLLIFLQKINIKFQVMLKIYTKDFHLQEIKDELTRVARNPQIKFSKNERFEKPLKILIENKKEIDSFKTIFNLISENDYSNIDGFREFRYNFENGLEEFLKIIGQ